MSSERTGTVNAGVRVSILKTHHFQLFQEVIHVNLTIENNSQIL